MDIDKGAHCSRTGMSALCENVDAPAHAHQDELGKMKIKAVLFQKVTSLCR